MTAPELYGHTSFASSKRNLPNLAGAKPTRLKVAGFTKK
jgi:hypothetical protein